jgi:hypothetical protein
MAPEGQKVIARKIAKVRREGASKKAAAGKAFGMARSGKLGKAAQAHARAHPPRRRTKAGKVVKKRRGKRPPRKHGGTAT